MFVLVAVGDRLMGDSCPVEMGGEYYFSELVVIWWRVHLHLFYILNKLQIISPYPDSQPQSFPPHFYLYKIEAGIIIVLIKIISADEINPPYSQKNIVHAHHAKSFLFYSASKSIRPVDRGDYETSRN